MTTAPNDDLVIMQIAQPALLTEHCLNLGNAVRERLGLDPIAPNRHDGQRGAAIDPLTAVRHVNNLNEPPKPKPVDHLEFREMTIRAAEVAGGVGPTKSAIPIRIDMGGQSRGTGLGPNEASRKTSRNKPRFCADEDHIDHVVRCLATGAPILFLVDRKTAKELGASPGIAFTSHNLGHRAQTMALSEVASIRGGKDDAYLAAFGIFGQVRYRKAGYRKEHVGDVFDALVFVQADGTTESWIRSRNWTGSSVSRLFGGIAESPEQTVTPAAFLSSVRKLARSPEKNDFKQLDLDRHLAGCGAEPRQAFLFEEDYAPQKTIMGDGEVSLKDAMFIAAAAAGDLHGRTIAAARLLGPSAGASGEGSNAVVLRDIYRTARNDPERAKRLHQAVAIAPAVYAYPKAAAMCADGVSLPRALAETMIDLSAEPLSLTMAHKRPVHGLMAIRSNGVTVDELERSARIVLPQIDPRPDKLMQEVLENYLAVQSLIGRRNRHIRPQSPQCMAAMSHLLVTVSEPAYRGAQTGVDERRIARLCAARLDANQVRLQPSGLDDVVKWTMSRLMELGLQNPAQFIGERGRQVTDSQSVNYAEIIVDAAAIRLGGCKGLNAINEAWHHGLNALEDARQALAVEECPTSAEDLEERLRLPTIDKAIAGVEIRCLTNAGELEREGREIGHCVRTYDRLVRQGRSFILRLESDMERSTAELRLTPKGTFELIQHETVGRKAPGSLHRKAIEDYRNVLQMNAGLIAGLQEAKAQAAVIYAEGTSFGAALSSPAKTRLCLDQIAALLLPPSMKGLTLEDMRTYLEDQERLEHLLTRSPMPEPETELVFSGF